MTFLGKHKVLIQALCHVFVAVGVGRWRIRDYKRSMNQ